MDRCAHCTRYYELFSSKNREFVDLKGRYDLLQLEHLKHKKSSQKRVDALTIERQFLRDQLEQLKPKKKSPQKNLKRSVGGLVGSSKRTRKSYTRITKQQQNKMKSKVIEYIGGDESELEFFIADLLNFRVRSTSKKEDRIKNCIATNTAVPTVYWKKASIKKQKNR